MISLYKIYKSDQLNIGECVEIKSKSSKTQVSISDSMNQGDDGLSLNDKSIEIHCHKMVQQAEHDAREVIASAEKEAAEVLEKSYSESKELLEQSKEQGYAEGYEKGVNEGREQGYLEMTSLIDEAKLLKQQAYDARNQLSIQLEKDLVQLVIQTARRILQSELQENQELLFQLIDEGLKKCNYTENLVIHVSEMDYDMVYAYQNRIYLMTDGIYDIEIKSDPSMSPGSVLIETASGQVDAGIETQLKQIEAAFEELLQSGESV